MSWPFGGKSRPRQWRGQEVPVDPDGRRLLGLTLEGGAPIFAPRGHSLLLAAAGGGKTTCGAMTWLFSYSASPQAVLILDSKNEIAVQAATMLAAMGRKVAIIDDMGELPVDCPHRISLNPFAPALAAQRDEPRKLIFAAETITHAAIDEPQRDEKNRYWRSWPRSLTEFGLTVLLKRNPELATPGGVSALLSDPTMMRGFAAIEADEGDPALKAMAINVLEMTDHEHWPQHLEAAQHALRIYRPGSQLHGVGSNAKLTHADLIREGYVIFLVGPQAHIARLGLHYALHILAFASALYTGAGPLRVIADEFTNAPLRQLVEALTTLRAFGAEVHMIAQSRSEIERKFGKLETETIEENAIVKQWFGFSSFGEAERVSKAMGEEQVVTSSLGADSESLRLSSNLQLVKQRWMSPAELMAMPGDQQLIHIKGIGFFLARKIGQHQIAPYCHQIAPNPLEGGRLKPDPIITLAMPTGAGS